MTKQEQVVLSKVRKLIAEDAAFHLENCRRLLESGAIELQNWGDDYQLPSILLFTSMRQREGYRRPTKQSDRQTAHNLTYF